MTTIDLNNLPEDDKGTGSDFFKFPTGDTKIRIMTEMVQVKQIVEGVYPDTKLLGMVQEGQKLTADQKIKVSGWAWCNVEGEGLKIITFPYSLIKQIGALKQMPDYSWEDMPMPYEITVKNTGKGGDRYSITPARENTEVDSDVVADLESKTTIEEIVNKIKDKAENKEVDKKFEELEYPESEGETAF